MILDHAQFGLPESPQSTVAVSSNTAGTAIYPTLPKGQQEEWLIQMAELVAPDERKPAPIYSAVLLTPEQRATLLKQFQDNGITQDALSTSGVLSGNVLDRSILHRKVQEFVCGKEICS